MRELDYEDVIRSKVAAIFGSEQKLRSGLVYIPQEGTDAGVAKSLNFFEDFADEGNCASIGFAIEGAFGKGAIISEEFWQALCADHSDLVYVIEEGGFGTPIAVAWALTSEPHQTVEPLARLAMFLVTLIEISKKSEFHRVISGVLHEFEEHGIYEGVAIAIQHGLYCNQVLVWQVDEKDLIGKNPEAQEMDLSISNSLAGEVVLTGQHVIVNDFREDSRYSKVEYSEWVEEREHRAAVFIPIHDNAGVTGVVGIFYNRPYGATAVDIELAEYITAYFEKLWILDYEAAMLKSKLSGLQEFESIYLDVLRCLSQLHDLPSIHNGAQGALFAARAKFEGKGSAEAFRHLSVVGQSLDLIVDIIDPHTTAISFAKKHYQELKESGGISELRRGSVKQLVEREVVLFRNFFIEHKIHIDIEIEQTPERMKFAASDLGTIIRNLLQNSARSLLNKTHTRRQIKLKVDFSEPIATPRNVQINISVRDNGVGIQEELLSEIFEPEYTTYKHQGGKGQGLAIVDRVVRSHGFVPNVESEWGRFCEVNVTISGFNLG